MFLGIALLRRHFSLGAHSRHRLCKRRYSPPPNHPVLLLECTSGNAAAFTVVSAGWRKLCLHPDTITQTIDSMPPTASNETTHIRLLLCGGKTTHAILSNMIYNSGFWGESIRFQLFAKRNHKKQEVSHHCSEAADLWKYKPGCNFLACFETSVFVIRVPFLPRCALYPASILSIGKRRFIKCSGTLPAVAFFSSFNGA